MNAPSFRLANLPPLLTLLWVSTPIVAAQTEPLPPPPPLSGGYAASDPSLTPWSLLPEFNDGYLTYYMDNDLIGGTDEDYTNGVRLSWISMAREVDRLSGIYRGLNNLSEFAHLRNREQTWVYNYGLSLTQLMFTPEDTEVDYLIKDDRPYAGWLGVGFSLHAKTERQLHTLELSVGVVGPNSLAENAQDSIHSLRDIDKAQGWDNQLRSEYTLNLHYRRTQRLFEWSPWGDVFEIDGLYRWGVDLGNAWVNVQGGAWIRFGFNLPNDFSDPKLSVTSYTHQLFTERQELVNPWSLYFTVAGEGRLVARDIFLDGNTFEDSHSVDKKYAVADLTAAVNLRYKGFRISYAHSYRTREYDQQDDGQVFGSLSLGITF